MPEQLLFQQVVYNFLQRTFTGWTRNERWGGQKYNLLSFEMRIAISGNSNSPCSTQMCAVCHDGAWHVHNV